MLFRGTVIYQKNGWYASLIFPIVQLKKAFQIIYNFILKSLWSELIFGKQEENELVSLLFFAVFIILSLLTYYFQAYIQIIFIAFIIVWYLDYFWAKNQYIKAQKYLAVSIKSKQEEKIVWQMSLPNREILQSEFMLTQIKEITIIQRPVYGGAFQELMGTVWQIEVNLYDGNNFLLDEQVKVVDALKQAKKLSSYFNVPIIFTSAQGNSDYVEEKPKNNYINLSCQSETQFIRCIKNDSKWHIYSKWNSKNSWRLFTIIFQDLGFLFFLLIMAKFMIHFGQLISALINYFWQRSNEFIDLENPLNWFIPNLDWKDWLGLAIALILMVLKGWQLSRPKHIYLDKYYLKFFIDNQKITQVNTQDIESVLFINNLCPEILILTKDQAIIIQKLQQEEDFVTFLSKIDEGVQHFQRQNTNQKSDLQNSDK